MTDEQTWHERPAWKKEPAWWSCDRCTHGVYDSEYAYRYTNDGEPVTMEIVLCNQFDIKDGYYNGVGTQRKKKNDLVDVTKQPPLPCGIVCWACNGRFFNDAGHTIIS